MSEVGDEMTKMNIKKELLQKKFNTATVGKRRALIQNMIYTAFSTLRNMINFINSKKIYVWNCKSL